MIERAFQLLRLLAASGKRGQALTPLAQAARLPPSTVHRLLRRLCAERMVTRDEAARRYMLGPLAFELGLAVAERFDLREPCRPFLRELALEVGDTVYLTVRSGDESMCADRYEGPSPIRVFTLDVGSRRPLGLGAGGLAMLAALPAPEREAVLGRVAGRVSEQGNLPEDELRAAVEDCRAAGYALIRSRITFGVSAVGVVIQNSFDQAVAAISVAAVDVRMSPERIKELVRSLRYQKKRIEAMLYR